MIVSDLKEIIAVKVGTTDIEKVYVGEDKVFPDNAEKDYFYIWHTATGIIERVEVTDSFNIVEKVTPGYSYFGYANNAKGKGTYAIAIENGEADTLTFVDNKLQDIDCRTFDGTVYTSTGTNANTIVKTAYYTSSGLTMTPVKDTIYYLVEIDPRYLIPYFLPAKDANDNIGTYGVFTFIPANTLDAISPNVDGVDESPHASGNYTYTTGGITYTVNYASAGLPRGNIVCSDNSLGINWTANQTYLIKIRLRTLDLVVLSSPTMKVETNDLQYQNIVITYPYNS